MTDITEFLLARIAEDEEAARIPVSEYEEGEGWYGEQSRNWLRRHLDPFDQVEDNDSHGYPTVDFIIRNSPARVLAECEAKRRIVAMHVENESRVAAYRSPRWVDDMNDDDRLNARKAEARCATTEVVIHALAQVYADHPDFDPSWT